MSTVMTKQFADRISRIEVSATMAMVAEGAKLRAQGVDVVDLGMGEPHFHTPEHVKRAAIEAIEHNFTKYTGVPGIPELRAAIAERHGKDFSSDYVGEECMITTGGKQALFNSLQTLVDHGDEVIIPVPYWVSFKDIVQYAGGKCVFVECDEADDFRLTAAMIERAITPRTRAIILNTPNNPSGAVMSAEDLAGIVRTAHKRGIYVISDECYVYLNYTGKLVSAGEFRDAKEHLVLCGSFSKTYAMTGWRTGYALAPKPLITAMTKLQSQSTSSPNAISQKAALAAVTGPQDCIQTMRDDYLRLRKQALDALATIPDVRCGTPNGAFYVYPNVSAYFGRGGIRSSRDLSERLLREAHVTTTPGDAFGTRDHIRLAYATSSQEVARGIERIAKFLASL